MYRRNGVSFFNRKANIMERSYRILMVDDSRSVQSALIHLLKRDRKDIAVTSAFTIEEAEAIVAQDLSFDLIIMDCCVPGGSPNTRPLVEKIRQTYTGPMIAISTEPLFSQALVGPGLCSHQSEKGRLLDKIAEVLGIKI